MRRTPLSSLPPALSSSSSPLPPRISGLYATACTGRARMLCCSRCWPTPGCSVGTDSHSIRCGVVTRLAGHLSALPHVLETQLVSARTQRWTFRFALPRLLLLLLALLLRPPLLASSSRAIAIRAYLLSAAWPLGLQLALILCTVLTRVHTLVVVCCLFVIMAGWAMWGRTHTASVRLHRLASVLAPPPPPPGPLPATQDRPVRTNLGCELNGRSWYRCQSGVKQVHLFVLPFPRRPARPKGQRRPFALSSASSYLSPLPCDVFVAGQVLLRGMLRGSIAVAVCSLGVH